MSEQYESEYKASEAERAAARMKSYTGSAVLVFILYWFFFIPGLIVNYIYYREAQRMRQLAGHSLPGQGCLGFMLWLNVILIGISILGGVLLLIGAAMAGM